MKGIKMILLLLLAIGFTSCKKYLDAKPDATLAIPSTLNDLQGLLDYYALMNTSFPGSTDILIDDYYLTFEDWSAISNEDQRIHYIWQKQDNFIGDWNPPYKSIYACNLILETLKTIPRTSSEESLSENIQGAALFFRATYFYSIAQLFAKGYDRNTSVTDPGIPLRLSTDILEKSTRATVKQTYDQIIIDLKNAARLLPLNTLLKSRPTKAAAYGSLARTYLAMQDYTNAGAYSDSCLILFNTLMDYNSLDSNSSIPIARFNAEVIFQATSYAVQPNSPNICKIDSNLYRSYSANDLRKVIYFKNNGNGTYAFKGDYDGANNNGNGHSFTGIVTDEQYLIKAECEARLGKKDNALKYLNTLLEKRWRKGYFTPVTSADSMEVLKIILNERRKELLFRATRLTDLKRLNQDPRFAVTLIRRLNGTIYQLSPNDVRYVALIPKTTIDISGMQQNP